MKNYLHRPIEIPYFLPTGDLKNVLHNFKMFFIFSNALPAS